VIIAALGHPITLRPRSDVICRKDRVKVVGSSVTFHSHPKAGVPLPWPACLLGQPRCTRGAAAEGDVPGPRPLRRDLPLVHLGSGPAEM